MFNFAYPVGDLLGSNFTEQMQSLKRQLELKEKYQRPEGSSGYDFSGDREQLAQDMADLGFVDNNPMTMEAITSKYTGFLNDLYGVPPISGTRPPMDILEPKLPSPKYIDPMPTPDYIQGGPARLLKEPEPIARPGIEALMPEEEGYKKYIASDTNPFESMGVSSLGQDALKQMIFERNNPQANQSRGYKNYIG